MNMKKILLLAMILMVSSFAVSAELLVSSVSIDGERVLEMEDGVITSEQSLVVERGENFDVKVKVFATTSQENVVVSTEILGYEFAEFDNSLEDQVSPFDLELNDSKILRLSLAIPDNAEKDSYDLRVRVSSRTGATQEYLVGLRLDGQRHELKISDIQVPNTIVAGRSIIGNVRVANIGQKTEESVKVTLSIPELNIEDSEYIDEINDDDSTTSEDLLLRVPTCTAEGYYDVVATVEYHDGYKAETKSTEIKVLASDVCAAASATTTEAKTIITVPSGQEVVVGKSVVYPVVISNMGKSAKTYVISVSPSVEAFGSYRIDPSNVMIVSGESTETAYVYLTVDENAQTGMRDFKITVTAEGEVKDATLTANIVADGTNDSTSLKTGLQVSLLVLVVLLLILLVIFGFNKMKGSKEDEEDEDEAGQTYY